MNLEPGTGLHDDPTGDRLLLTQRSLALIDTTSLRLTLLEKPVRQAHWLVAG